MLTHMWVQDEVDLEEVSKQYTDIKIIWRGGRPHKLKGKYCGEEVLVQLVSKREACDCRNWGGFELQKIICFERISTQATRYLLTRLRTRDKLPEYYTETPEDVILVVEKLEGKAVFKDTGVEFSYFDNDTTITGDRLEKDLKVFL